ncbi:4-diphosphocytidyl-2C-methyl-D-erythritol synthase [Streptomyces sulfonofaciens]|uniref:4-diphosphocytidyl-2C-methyl-D-erythritol synthase n=1 Tax=Streptomyces sulfonofaciens TaxID=68272 RepID=A0A919L0G3_9ACTN|nr:nucleotidyltransferase family protein [Streptomyces sulfonofaciens]GHH79348.1 4-diphosphocytidyl-2C-methyl-D-erythritol synthase [Streptomyces sulfonofaciens]
MTVTDGGRGVRARPAGEVVGLLLAAGGGRRLGGRPKALLRHRGRPLVEHAVRALRAGGCERIHVVLGAEAARVRAEAELSGCALVGNPAWEEGMGSSLRTGLASLTGPAGPTGSAGPAEGTRHVDAHVPGAAVDAVLVMLVDQPGIGAEAVARVRAAYRSRDSLASAAYDGRRGHPVLFGAEHWAGIAAGARGDQGARAYLAAHADALTLVECGDVAEPYDIDTAEDLGRLE